MKKNIRKSVALFLVLVMVGSMAVLSACSGGGPASGTLVAAYTNFNGKFSPFFANTQNDQDVATTFCSAGLFETDREGNPILNGMNGVNIDYNGTSYKYNEVANVDVVQNTDGTVDYNITMRKNVVFSDGVKMNIDDVIFTMYVLCDPSYDGGQTLASTPIVGVKSYQTGVSDTIYSKYEDMANAIFAAGPDNTDFTNWTQDQQNAYFGDYLNAAGVKFVGDIVNYCLAHAGSMSPSESDCYGNDIAMAMANWGYGDLSDSGVLTADPSGKTYDLANGVFPTAADFFSEILANYGLNFSADDGINCEQSPDASNLIQDYMNQLFISGEGPKDPSAGGVVANIAGIKRTGDYSMTVTTSSFDPTTIYQLGVPIAPLHYYGDTSKYDYNNNEFGFTKGDLSGVHAKDGSPLGAGPYVFQSYQNGVVTLQANPKYYKGAPKIEYLRLQETQSADMVAGLLSGTFDVATGTAFNDSDVQAIKAANSNGELVGNALTTYTVDNLGYGYIGINAQTVNVGGDPGSDASKDLRLGFATELAAFRQTVVNSYYGDRATVIEYPISNTSWAAPRPSDDGYAVAYSTDVSGSPIYTDSMSETDKEAAALQAAIGFFKAAGYTWDSTANKFTAAPAGASMSYEIMIAGGGTGNHPSYGILTAAHDALTSIGIDLQINDASDGGAAMFNAMNAGTAEMFCAAWQVTPDPDMYQIYDSSNVPGKGGTNSNSDGIADPNLDKLIMEARQSADQSFRKATYKQCLDIILQWGVEIPIYQRLNATYVSTERVNISSIPGMTTYWDWRNDIQSITMVAGATHATDLATSMVNPTS